VKFVFGVGILAVILLLVFSQPLAAGEMTLGTNSAAISFTLRNRFPLRIRVNQVRVPLDATGGVLGSSPHITGLDGLEHNLVGYPLKPLSTVQVVIPVTGTDKGYMPEIRLEYRLLGIPKHVTVTTIQDM